MTFLVSQNGVLHGDRSKRGLISIEQRLWPNATVPYTFGSGISGEEEQNSANIPEKSCMLHKLVILK